MYARHGLNIVPRNKIHRFEKTIKAFLGGKIVVLQNFFAIKGVWRHQEQCNEH